VNLTADDRRARYAAQAGAGPDLAAWTGTSAQRRRIIHKDHHANLTRTGTARRARALAVADARVIRRADREDLLRMLIGRRPKT